MAIKGAFVALLARVEWRSFEKDFGWPLKFSPIISYAAELDDEYVFWTETHQSRNASQKKDL